MFFLHSTAGLEKSKGEGLHQQKLDTPKVSKKKKVKDTQPDTGVSLKTKIKRSGKVIVLQNCNVVAQ